MSIKQQETPTIVSVFSLLDWVEAFMLDRKSRGLSQGTIEFYRKKLKHFVDFCSKNQIRELMELSASDLRTFFLHLQNKGHNQGGVYAHFKVMRSFLYWYEDENELVEWSNPIKKVKVKSSSSQPLEPADIKAVKAILKTCKKDFTGVRDKAIILILLDTGIRASELISVDFDNVNPITSAVQILKGKGGKCIRKFI